MEVHLLDVTHHGGVANVDQRDCVSIVTGRRCFRSMWGVAERCSSGAVAPKDGASHRREGSSAPVPATVVRAAVSVHGLQECSLQHSCEAGSQASAFVGVRAHIRLQPPGVPQGSFKVVNAAWLRADTPGGCTSGAGTAGAGIVVDA